MYKLFQQLRLHLNQLIPCQLCGVDHQTQFSVCQDCWESLAWSKNSVHRQNIEIQVACHYDYPIDRVIQQFKYEQKLHYQHLLFGVLSTLKLPKVQAIVPMPISEQRLIERGFNQSLILAKFLAHKFKVPIWQPIIRQHQHSQKGLNRLERIDNIEQQFQIITTEKKKFKRVLILDDIVTTGSSIHALKQKLEHLGCQKIYACCIAAAQN